MHGFHGHAADRIHDAVCNNRRGPFEFGDFRHHLGSVVRDKRVPDNDREILRGEKTTFFTPPDKDQAAECRNIRVGRAGPPPLRCFFHLEGQIADLFAGVAELELIVDRKKRCNRDCRRRTEAGCTGQLGSDVYTAFHIGDPETFRDVRGVWFLIITGMPNRHLDPGFYRHRDSRFSVNDRMFPKKDNFPRSAPCRHVRSLPWQHTLRLRSSRR